MTADAAEQFRSLRAKTELALPEFIGLPVEEAIERAQRLGLDLRVIRINENKWHTSDERSTRITVEIENGVVTSAKAE
jgi:hypothetical protein